MITVFVWEFRGKDIAWGHAAMLVRKTYMSWWPEHPGQVPSKLHPNLYASYPIRFRTFQDDVNAEGHPPDHQIHLDGMGEEAALDWWQSFGLSREGVRYHGPPLPWKTLQMNCSTVVATGLKRAGGDRYSSFGASFNVVWTPNAVLSYAKSIRARLENGRIKR